MVKRISFIISLLLTFTAISDQLQFKASLAHPALIKGEENHTYLKIGLTGFEFNNDSERPKTNIALVIDRSGSMQGDKIVRAKEAAIMTINRLNSEDIVSIVTYSDQVEVVVPATKMTDKDSVINKINSISASGSTALFAGVSKGGAEVKKFIDKNRINRVVLLSDGQANIGPSSPTLLGDLALSLAKQNVAVTTIGLGQGYNENVMVALARKGEGNHYFVDKPEALAATFNREFGDLMSVCAKDIMVEVTLKNGAVCKRSLGRKATINGSKVSYKFPRVYSGQEKFLMLELIIPKSITESVSEIADVKVAYYNAKNKVNDKLASTVSCRFVTDTVLVKHEADRAVIKDAVEQIAAVNMVEAIRLREAGQLDEAQQMFTHNRLIIDQNMKKYGMKKDLYQYQFLNAQAQDVSNAKQIQSFNHQAVTNSTPSIPKFGEKTELGVVLTVTPTVTKGSKEIELIKLSPKMSKFLSYDSAIENKNNDKQKEPKKKSK